MLINKKDGTPFPTKFSASGQASRKELKFYNIVEVDGGFSIEVPDEEQQDSQPEDIVAKDHTAMTTATDEIPETAAKTEEGPSVKIVKAWEPAKPTDVPDEYREPGRRYRWANTLIDGNIQKKIAEGWVIDHDVSKKRRKLGGEFAQKTTSPDTTTRLRELILMWIPEKMAEQRAKYYNDMSEENIAQSESQLADELQGAGTKTYGKVQVSRG